MPSAAARVPPSWAARYWHRGRPALPQGAPAAYISDSDTCHGNDYAPTVILAGAAGTFSGLGSSVQSGHAMTELTVTGWGFGAGEALFYTLAMPDGQIILSTTPLTDNELQPTYDHAEINVFDPARCLFYSDVIPTSLGATTALQPGWNVGGTDAGGGDMCVVNNNGTVMALFTCSGYYFGWQISIYGLYPTIGYLAKASGNWAYDSAASLTGDQLHATAPALFESVFEPSPYANAYGETYWNPRGMAQVDNFPQSGNVLAGCYFPGNGFNSGLLNVVSPSGTLLASYQVPDMNQSDGVTPITAAVREVKCDPSSSAGDERFTVIYDVFPIGNNAPPAYPHVVQEFSYDNGSQTITPKSVPCVTTATDAQPQAMHFDQWGNLYLCQASIILNGGLQARAAALFCKNSGERALVTSAPATGNWATDGAYATPVAPDYYLGFADSAGSGFAAPLGFNPLTNTLFHPGSSGPMAISQASAQPVPGQFGSNMLSAADSTFSTWTGNWTGFLVNCSQYTALGFDDSFSMEMNSGFALSSMEANCARFAVTPGQAYQVTAELYSFSGNQAASGYLAFTWFDGSGNQIGFDSNSTIQVAALSTTWQQAMTAQTAPANAATAVVKVYIVPGSGTMAANTSFLVDVVVIRPQTQFTAIAAVEIALQELRNVYSEFVIPGRPALSGNILWCPVGLYYSTSQINSLYGTSYVPAAVPQYVAGVQLNTLNAWTTFYYQDAEHCTGTDASIITAHLSDSDASGQALDGGEITTILGSDASAITAETAVSIALASADASGITAEASTITAAIADGDASESVDAGETITAVLADTDASTSADAGEQLQHADFALGVPLLPPSWKAGYAHLARPVLPQPLPSEIGIGSADASGTAADGAEVIRVADTDASQPALDAGESVAPEISPPVSTRSGPAWQARFRHTARPVLPAFAVGGTFFITDTEAARSADTGAPLGAVSTDALSGTDSGFTAVADAESAQASDSERPFAQADADASQLTLDLELTAWPRDADASTSSDSAYWSGPLADTEASTSADTGTIAVSDADAGHSAEVLTLDIYSFQPSFRFTGGGYEVVVRHPRGETVIARSPALTPGLLELGRRVTGVTELVSDWDTSRSEELERPLLAVHVHVQAAVQVSASAE